MLDLRLPSYETMKEINKQAKKRKRLAKVVRQENGIYTVVLSQEAKQLIKNCPASEGIQ